MSEIIDETINELNKPTHNNVFSIEDNPVTVLEKINQVERYLKQIDTSVDTSINTANEALEKANNAFEANGTLVKINGENQLTWSADFAESEKQKSITDGAIVHESQITDVEHIELIYDMSSSDANINQGKTSGVQFNSSNANYVGNATTSKYEYFYVYVKIVNQIVCVKMKSDSNTSIMAQNYADQFGTLTMGILINSFDAIYAHDIRSILLPSGSFTTHYDNSDYVITKVEGVLL